MRYQDIIHLPITATEVKQAITRAQRVHFIDNLRYRHPNVSFDSKVRGYVGEIGFRKWLKHHNVPIEAQNQWSERAQMDVDFQCKGRSLELKTSLIPNVDNNLKTSFQRRDIKLIKRKAKVSDLCSDIHVQIYFNQNKKLKEQWLREQKIDLTNADTDQLYNQLLGRAYLKHTYLVAWMDKQSLQDRLQQLPLAQQTWSHAKRQFWVCPLRHCFAPNTLIDFLNARS
ncbi:MAG: hypothetical protein AAGI23_00360 [Bacteroidota bacterium]